MKTCSLCGKKSVYKKKHYRFDSECQSCKSKFKKTTLQNALLNNVPVAIGFIGITVALMSMNLAVFLIFGICVPIVVDKLIWHLMVLDVVDDKS